MTEGDTQLVLLDTPGFHKPRSRLGDYMVKVARDSFPEVGTLPRVPAQEQKKPYIAQARYYIEQRGQTDMRNILIDTVYVLSLIHISEPT